MHELSLCQALVRQVARVAAEHDASAIERVVVAAGPLSGVEPDLLVRAFSVARAGTIAGQAELDIEITPVTVRCRQCGASDEVPVERLVCPACGDWRVEVIQGEDLVLMRVEMALPEPSSPASPTETANGVTQNV